MARYLVASLVTHRSFHPLGLFDKGFVRSNHVAAINVGGFWHPRTRTQYDTQVESVVSDYLKLAKWPSSISQRCLSGEWWRALMCDRFKPPSQLSCFPLLGFSICLCIPQFPPSSPTALFLYCEKLCFYGTSWRRNLGGQQSFLKTNRDRKSSVNLRWCILLVVWISL